MSDMTEEVIMERDDTFWLTMVSILMVTLTTISLGGCSIYSRHVEKMAELGYQKVMLQGSKCPVWQKVGDR